MAPTAFASRETGAGGHLCGIIGAVAEVTGLCLFTLVIATEECIASRVIIYMNGIYLLPTGWQLLKQVRKRCSNQKANGHDDYHAFGEYQQNDDDDENGLLSWKHTAGLVLSLLFAIGGLAYAVYSKIQEPDTENLGLFRRTAPIIMFMVLLSFAWCPKIRKLQIRAKGNAEVYDEDIFEDDDRHLYDWQRIRVKTARERMTVITSLVKLCLTPFMAAAFAKAFELNVHFKDLKSGFEELNEDRYLLAMLVAQVVCSFFAKVFAYLACTLGLQKLCFASPLIISTPLSIILVATKGCNALGLCNCQTNLGNVLQIVILAGLLWLAQIFSTVIYIWQSQQFQMAKEDTLFWLPGYDGVLTEQSLILNRKNEATDDYYVSYRQLVKDSTIYICTTMYHEADFEMEQLLHSIAGVDAARKESKRQFESHIFLDDGVRGRLFENCRIEKFTRKMIKYQLD
eukprot:gene10509-19228_t